ncbi:JAB domain-containing protein [Acidomonas methanolica]|uniref:JAB domain-containing protein n=1 Tax=Acidomonas methanolica TaxID=437 RepID=UPI00211A14AF|nr:DNA repair protein RadC [Acidomonas methanolica]MCQ9155067.1 DNA repair protein RadC [Acidomonas methanolica]
MKTMAEGSEGESLTFPEAGSAQEPWVALLTGRGRHLDDATLIRLFVLVVAGKGERSERLSAILQARYGTFSALLCASDDELRGIRDIGQHLIPMVRVLHEAAVRYTRARMDAADVLGDAASLLDYLTARLAREPVEQFRVLFLGEGRRLIADEAQARGTVNHTPVYPREVARRAMELGAASVVLVHNHPSGDPTPSEADLVMTRQIQAGLAAIGIETADHFIIGNGRHISFRALDLL